MSCQFQYKSGKVCGKLNCENRTHGNKVSVKKQRVEEIIVKQEPKNEFEEFKKFMIEEHNKLLRRISELEEEVLKLKSKKEKEKITHKCSEGLCGCSDIIFKGEPKYFNKQNEPICVNCNTKLNNLEKAKNSGLKTVVDDTKGVNLKEKPKRSKTEKTEKTEKKVYQETTIDLEEIGGPKKEDPKKEEPKKKIIKVNFDDRLLKLKKEAMSITLPEIKEFNKRIRDIRIEIENQGQIQHYEQVLYTIETVYNDRVIQLENQE